MKKLFTILSISLAASTTIAQSPFLSNNSLNANEKYAPGAITTITPRILHSNQDRVEYYSENFDAGFGTWLPAIQTGTAGFKLTNSGHDNATGNSFIIPTLETSTPTQWILLDSDKDGTSYTAPEEATFTSSVIDLSASAGSFVALEFDQFFAEWQIDNTNGTTEDHTFLAVSTDSINWTEIEINEGVGREARANPEKVSFDISNAIAGNESTVYFRFRWDGAWNYGWQFDNIRVVDLNEKDIAITQMWKNSFGGISYSQLPLSHTDTIVVGAVLKNIGHIDQTNVTFDYVVKDPAGVPVANGTATDVLSLTNNEFDTIFVSTDFMPSALGVYTVEITAVSTEGDDDVTNNFESDNNFEITEYKFAQYYNVGSVEEISSWPLATGQASFGIFTNFTIDDVVSGLDVQLTSYTENVGEEISAVIYKYNTTADPAAWEIVASSPHEITADDIGTMISVAFKNGFSVDSVGSFFVGVMQNDVPVKPLFVRQGDIKFSNIQGFNDENGALGFFDRKSPIVRVRVNEAEVKIDENRTSEFSIYPNPANFEINIILNQSVSEIKAIKVLDVTGKVVISEDLNTKVINIESLTKGVYFLEIESKSSKTVKKFVKY